MERQKEKDQGLERREERNHKDELSQGFLNIRQIADYLGIKASTIYALVERRGIPHYKVGRLVRFKKSEVDQWMEGQKEQSLNTKIRPVRVVAPFQRRPSLDVSRIVKKAIDGAGKKRYTSRHGKPDHIKGLRKEVEHGTV